AERAESGSIVVPGHEADAALGWDVPPIPAPLQNERPRIVRPEAQCRRPRPITCVCLSNRFPVTPYLQTEADARRIQEPPGSGCSLTRQVLDSCEPKVPTLVELRPLCLLP